jgi:ABC-type microcin C transport system permease subunit YejE
VAGATLAITSSPLGIMIGAIAGHGVATVVCTHMNGIQSGVSTLLLTIIRHLFVHHICTQFFYLIRFGNTNYKEVIFILCFVVGYIKRLISW